MHADDGAVELHKLEYEKAAERYDNIYRSMWTIFSYLTAVAAGVLAFGADRIERHALICFAASPLIFWFWTTYLPLDRYGTESLRRLGQIEKLLNTQFHTTLDHFMPSADKELSVFKGLRQAFKAKTKKSKAVWDQVHRARFAIGFIFFLLHVAVIWNLMAAFRSRQPLFQRKPRRKS